MRQSQKAVFSLLISIVVFGIFAYFSFSGFFEMLQNDFYSRTKIKSIQERLIGIEYSIDLFNSDHLQKLSSILSRPSFKNVFSANQSSEDIRDRENTIGEFKSAEPEMIRMRIIDSDLKRIHYSTDKADLKNISERGIIYSNYSDVSNPENLESVKNGIEHSSYRYDEKSQTIMYVYPIKSEQYSVNGFAVLSLGASALEGYLQKTEALKVNEQIIISHVGLVIGLSSGIQGAALLKELENNISQENPSVVYLSNETGLRYVMISGRNLPQQFAFVIPEGILLLNPVLKLILLAAFFITCFLLIFFILNARHGPEIIIAERLQKLRTFFIDETLYSNKDRTGEKLLQVLHQRKSDLMGRLTRGLKFKNEEERLRVESKIEKVMEDIIYLSREKFDSYKMVRETPKKEIPHIPGGGESGVDGRNSDEKIRSKANDGEKMIIPEEDVKSENVDTDDLEELEDLEALDDTGISEGGGNESIRADVVSSEYSEDSVQDAEEVEELEDVEELEEFEELEEVKDFQEVGGKSPDKVPGFRIETVNGSGLKKDDEEDLEELSSVDEEVAKDPAAQKDESTDSVAFNGGIDKWKLPGTKIDFKDSGLPAIDLDKIDGVGAIEITAESENGRFSLGVNLLNKEIKQKEKDIIASGIDSEHRDEEDR